MEAQIPKTPLRFILWASKSRRYWALGAILAVLTGTALTRVQFYVLAQITDASNALVNTASASTTKLDSTPVWNLSLIYVGLFMLNQVTWRCSGFLGMQWLSGMLAFINEKLFGYLIRHSKQYFNDNFAGALANKISNAYRGSEAIVARALWEFLPLLVSCLANYVLADIYHPYLAWGFGAWFTFLIIVSGSFSLYLRPSFYEHAKASSTLTGKFVDCAGNIEAVQHAGLWRQEEHYAGEFIEIERKLHLRAWWRSEWVLVINNFLISAYTLSMLWLAVYLFEERAITIGSLVMVILMIFTFNRDLFFIGQRISETMGDYGKVQEGLNELLKPHDLVDAPDATPLKIAAARIKFEQLGFNYEDSVVFDNFNLEISAGQKVGLVGHSGVGKSTLVNLLLRQFDLKQGKIYVDGQNIAQVTLESLRQNIAMVPQNISLFHRSIMDNIRYGRTSATDEEVLQAARLASADEFIQCIPEKYDALVGERGVKLSGGQKQRIAIARAILKNAPILLLDEATSALDTESEAEIQKALFLLMQGKTVIAIAHRLSTLQSMDRIVVLGKQGIIEDGSHLQLLNRGGVYARLWNSQVDGFIREAVNS